MKFSHPLLVLALAGTFGTSSQLYAQKVHYQGMTAGCFYTTDTCTPGSNDTAGGLTYTQGFFDAWTSTSGFLGLGSGANLANNLGSFMLGSTPFDYSSTNFLLQVIFTLPTVTPSNIVYSASLLGDVETLADGGVNIHFDNRPQIFSFKGPDYDGTFTMNVADVNLTPGAGQAGVPVTAFIKTTVTPEPGTTALFATGLAGLIPMVRLRRRKNNAAV